MKKIIFLLISFILSTSIWAQENLVLNPDINKEVVLRLMIYTTLEESLLLDQKLYPEEISFIESDEWTDLVKKEVLPLLSKEQIQYTNKNPHFWKKTSRAIGSKFSNLIKSFRSTSRLNGFDVALLFVLGKSFEYALPGILLNMGLPGLATASLFIPIGTAIAAAYSLTKKMIKNQKLKKLYGGKENFQEIKLIEKSIEENLKLSKKGTLLLPFVNSDGQFKGLAINSSLSLKKTYITFTSLKKFLKQHDAKNLLNQLKDKDFSSLSKVIKIVNTIYESKNINLQKDFENYFAYATVDFIPLKDYGPLINWSFQSAHSKNCSELIQSVKYVPLGSSLNAVARLFEKVTLTYVAQTWSGAKFKLFKKLSEAIIKLRVEANLSEESIWSETDEIHFTNTLSAVCVD
jgi:hypothetical protein